MTTEIDARVAALETVDAETRDRVVVQARARLGPFSAAPHVPDRGPASRQLPRLIVGVGVAAGIIASVLLALHPWGDRLPTRRYSGEP